MHAVSSAWTVCELAFRITAGRARTVEQSDRSLMLPGRLRRDHSTSRTVQQRGRAGSFESSGDFDLGKIAVESPRTISLRTTIRAVPSSIQFLATPTLPYILRMDRLPNPFDLKDIRWRDRSVFGLPLSEIESDPSIELILGVDAGSIAARVSERSDEPTSRVTFVVLRADIVQAGNIVVAAKFADENGSALFVGVPPGVYTVVALRNPPAAFALRNGGVFIDPIPDALEILRQASFSGRRLDLRPGGTSSVTVEPW